MASMNLISELKPYKSNWKIKAKLLRVWKQVTTYGQTMEIILCDSEGKKIAGTVKKQFWSRFENLLIEGQTVVIRTFAVGPTMAAYKATDHAYKITFYQTTVVEPCDQNDQLPNTLTGWSFASYDDIVAGKLGIEFLVDIIGHIVNVGDITTFDNKGEEGKKINVELRNAEDTRIKCTLFGSYAEDVVDYVKTKQNKDVVLVMQFGRMSLYNDGWSVCNAFNCSKLIFNFTHAEVAEFRARLPKDGLDLNGVQSYNRQGKFVVFCEILDIVADMGWFYISCKSCQKKVFPREKIGSDEDVFYCEKCAKEVKVVVPRFLLHLRVKDHTGEATMIVFDKDGQQIVQRTAAELAETATEIDDPSVLPEAITLLKGKKFLFIVSVERANVVWKHGSYKVLRIASTRLTNQVLMSMSQNITICDNSQDEPSVRLGTSSLCKSKESAGEELTPYSKRKESSTKEITQEELTPSSKRKESEDVVCGESLDAPDQGSAVKKVCSVAIKQEKID